MTEEYRPQSYGERAAELAGKLEKHFGWRKDRVAAGMARSLLWLVIKQEAQLEMMGVYASDMENELRRRAVCGLCGRRLAELSTSQVKEESEEDAGHEHRG